LWLCPKLIHRTGLLGYGRVLKALVIVGSLVSGMGRGPLPEQADQVRPRGGPGAEGGGAHIEAKPASSPSRALRVQGLFDGGVARDDSADADQLQDAQDGVLRAGYA
jgi:hypothetical protein